MSNDFIKVETYRGYKIGIYQSEAFDDPNEWNEDRFLIYDHRSFCIRVKGFDVNEIYDAFQTKNIYKGFHVFPVYAYIHSGVALSLGRSEYPFNDRWDVSYRGFILIKKEKGLSWKREKAHKIAEKLIKCWNQYLSGEVYGFRIDELDDSCGGYYGNPEESGLLDEARSVIDYHISYETRKKFQKLKDFIKYHVPLEKRQLLLA